jgi:hypothetical protein
MLRGAGPLRRPEPAEEVALLDVTAPTGARPDPDPDTATVPAQVASHASDSDLLAPVPTVSLSLGRVCAAAAGGDCCAATAAVVAAGPVAVAAGWSPGEVL